jgi:hypothetical protein
MDKPMTAPGALRSNGGEVMTRSTMSLEALALEDAHAKSVRIVMTDTLPGGSKMELTLQPEQAADFAVSLHDVAKSAMTDADAAPVPVSSAMRPQVCRFLSTTPIMMTTNAARRTVYT